MGEILFSGNHSTSVESILVLNKDEFLTVGSKDKTLVKWSFSQKKKVLSADTDHSGTVITSLLKLDDRVVSGDSLGEIKIWSLPNLQNLDTF